MKRINTACPRNCYSTCSFQVEVDQGRIVGFLPQPLNKATPEGPCLKGLSYAERNVSGDRLIHPMKRTGDKFNRISWKEAYALIASKLLFYRDEYGPHSILYYAASGSSGLVNELSANFWRLYGGATTVYGNLCWPAGLEATRLMLGANKHNVPEDLAHAKLIVLWGKNPAETNIHQMVFINRALERGAKLLVIDPRITSSADRADLVLRVKPGRDGLLALAMAKIIIEAEQQDQEFIDKNVAGYESFKDSLNALDLEEAALETGIPLEKIRQAANWIGSIAPMTLIPGYGMQRYSNGGQTVRCLLSLSVITGNIGKQGACWHYANLQSYVFDKVKEPESYYPDRQKDQPFRRIIPTARLGAALLETSDPPIKMLWVERGNPLTQNPDSNEVKKAFGQMDFMVVVEQFMTDTALMADLVLPAKSMFEQSDIIGSYWNPYVQLKQKVLDPPGEVKPESTLYFELALAMGYERNEITKWIPEPADDIDGWLKNRLEEFPGLSWEELQKAPILAPGLETIPFSDEVFPTPSGKIELYSAQAMKRWSVSPLPTYEPLKNDKETYPFHLMSPNTKNRIHSQFGNLRWIKQIDPGPRVQVHPQDAREKGIQTGESIRVFNAKGDFVLPAQLDARVKKGTVVLYNGYWHQEGASPNILSHGMETDMGHGTAFHDTFVNFEKLKG
jgi:anaerobic selenocysteine-containing dehydrogenase